MIADTAIVGDGMFIHYCHKLKGFMALRTHHSGCPLCQQKNPDYIPNKMVHIVYSLKRDYSTVLIFADEQKAIQYIHDHPFDHLAIGDSGYVE